VTEIRNPINGGTDDDAYEASTECFILGSDAWHRLVQSADVGQAMAAHIGAHSIALRTCHVAMLDLPFKVADVIADAAGEE